MKKFLLLTAIAFNLNAAQLPEPKKLYETLKDDGDWIEKLNKQGALARPVTREQSFYPDLPLTKKYPGLSQLPYLPLCTLPTPVEELKNVKYRSWADIFVKKDGLSAQPYGGNKARKLQRELGLALLHGAKTVLTFGCAGSNHAVATSEHAAKLGLKAICMLKPQPNSRVVRQNLLLHATNGAQLNYNDDNPSRKKATIEKWCDHYSMHGDYPYIIPTGGSTPLGTLGFVDAAFELKEQIDANVLPQPDYIYVPCGSCATTAGLLLGCKAAGIKSKIMAIATEPEDTPGEFQTNINKLFQAANQLLHSSDESFPMYELTSHDLEINLDFTGTQYGLFTHEGTAACTYLKHIFGIITEGTYTAKAFAALLHDVEVRKSHGRILFWNTYCGHDFEERIASADYKKLPADFHKYFEQDVQELDRA